ncbi:DUF2382 domain-containing protein, partial [bacterium]
GLLAGLGLGVAVPFLGFLVAGPVAGLITGAAAGAATGGILGGLIGLGIPKEDAEYYAQGIERGGTLVVAEAQDAEIDRYEDILSGAGGHNVHEENIGGSTASTGTYAPAAAPGTAFAANSLSNQPTNSDYAASSTPLTGENDRLEVVEERLNVGKREVESGGVRVRRFVTETPVSEQVQLREEHVNVERHPVDRPVGTIGNDAFTERTIEVREPAYRYGAGLHNDARYSGREYGTFENDLRTDYETQNPGSSWDSVRETVWAGYDRGRGNYAYADRDQQV